MKRLLLLVIALMSGLGLNAQTNLNEAVDFTATDVHGTQVHLFDILDGGQYVLIDFFFTTCGPCQQVTPKLVESYYAMGCNMHDVYYMEIATGDSEASCINWANNYGVEYPTISGVAGGSSICSSYHITSYPTVILIAPDHSIVIKDLYPIPSAQTVITQLESHGVEQHECGSSPKLTFNIDTLWVSQVNNATPLYIYNNTSTPVVHLNKITIDTEDDWYYFVYDNQQILLNEEFDIPIAQGDSIQLDVVMNIVNKEMVYPILSFENTLETVQLVTAFEWGVSSQETQASSLTLFPNPANDLVTLKGESLCTVEVYNALGQKMDEFEANGNELRINTTNYRSGVYFLKSKETTLHFVISH